MNSSFDSKRMSQVAVLTSTISCWALFIFLPNDLTGAYCWIAVIIAYSMFVPILYPYRSGNPGLLRLLCSLGLQSANLIILYAAIYKSNLLNIADKAAQPSGSQSIYFSIVTWTTLGYGDISPTPQMQLIAASEALMGYLVLGILVATFADFLRQTT